MLLIILILILTIRINGEETPCKLNLIYNTCQLEPLYLFEDDNEVLGPRNCNAEIKASTFLKPPLVRFDDAQLGYNYTLIFVGNELILQWLVGNIPSCAFYNGDMTRFTQFAGYIPPTPVYGFATYQMMVYQQKSANIEIIFDRFKFNLPYYTREANLCGPVGGTQFIGTELFGLLK